MTTNPTLQTQRHEGFRNKRNVFQRHLKLITRHLEISEVDPKSTEDLRSWPEDFWRFPKVVRSLPEISKLFRRFTKLTQRLPKISEDGRKSSQDLRKRPEEFRRCLRFNQSLSKMSEFGLKSFRGFWSKHKQRRYKAYCYHILIGSSQFCWVYYT